MFLHFQQVLSKQRLCLLCQGTLAKLKMKTSKSTERPWKIHTQMHSDTRRERCIHTFIARWSFSAKKAGVFQAHFTKQERDIKHDHWKYGLSRCCCVWRLTLFCFLLLCYTRMECDLFIIKHKVVKLDFVVVLCLIDWLIDWNWL